MRRRVATLNRTWWRCASAKTRSTSDGSSRKLAAQELQGVAHAPEEIARRVDLVVVALVEHALFHQLAEVVDDVFDLGEPHRGVNVAQTALALFQLRLDQIDRVPIAAMTLFA